MIGTWQFGKMAFKGWLSIERYSILLVFMAFFSCQGEADRGALIAEVGDEKLYANDLYVLTYSSADSAAVVSAFVQQWVDEKILVNAAIADEEINQQNIDRKVEAYRNDLLINELENRQIEKQLDTVVQMNEIVAYYQSHKNDFQLNDYLVKVLYLKVPLDAPDIEKIGNLYKLKAETDLKQVEIYAKMYASNFYYDIESWIYFDDLLKEIPLHDINKDSFILKRSKIRFEENGFYYFLNIVDYKLKNSISPLSFEQENIKVRIINQRIKTLRESVKTTLLKRHIMRIKLNFIKPGILIFGLLYTLTHQAFAQDGGIKIIDKVVAQVGDEIILLSDIQTQRLQFIQNGEDGDLATDCAILEEFMYEKLLVNQAKIDSIEVPDEMVNQEMEQRLRYISSQIGSVEKLEEFYGKSVAQIKAEFFELIKKRMLAERMKQTITETVRITPKEVERFFNSLPQDSIPYINSKITVAQIVIYPKITDNDKKLAYDKLEGLRGEILNGKRFETMANLFSDDPGSSGNGGDLGWQTRGTMVPEFETALFQLKPGEISPVFETQYGYHIVKLMDRKGDNYSCKHILISPKISNEALIKASQKIDSLHRQISLGNLTFEDAARQFSDDENSKFNGGQIVNPYSGDYLWDLQNINEIDPQMSRMIDQLDVGKFSSPALYNNMMEQKQGIRIVKLLTRTEPHVASLNTDRQLIEMAAMNKKKQDVMDAWIASKVSGNFIQIDPEFLKSCNFQYKWVKGI